MDPSVQVATRKGQQEGPDRAVEPKNQPVRLDDVRVLHPGQRRDLLPQGCTSMLSDIRTAAGELCAKCGARVYLDRVPLKYDGNFTPLEKSG